MESERWYARVRMSRVTQADVLRAAAVMSVLFLHSLSGSTLEATWSVLHVWQAVPLLMVLMGFASQWGTVSRRLVRLLFPFAVLWVVSLVLGLVLNRAQIGWLSLALLLPLTGPGNYFVPVALCICLLLPLLRRLAKLSILLLVLCCGAINLAFELAAPHIGLYSTYPYLYSASFPRYLLCVALGFWLATRPRLRWVAIVGLASLVYLVGSKQFGWQPPFVTAWRSQNLLAAGYPALLVAAGLTYLPSKAPRLVTLIGRASYHIFLVQVLFFAATSFPGVWQLPMALVVCPLLGILWSRLEAIAINRTRAEVQA